MVSSRYWRAALRAKIAEHFELLLTTVGVLVAITLTFSQLDRGTQGLAFTFLVWLQGFLSGRCAVTPDSRGCGWCASLRVMLQDRVNNQVTVLLGVAELRGHEADSVEEEDVETAMTAAREVARELESLLARVAPGMGSPATRASCRRRFADSGSLRHPARFAGETARGRSDHAPAARPPGTALSR